MIDAVSIIVIEPGGKTQFKGPPPASEEGIFLDIFMLLGERSTQAESQIEMKRQGLIGQPRKDVERDVVFEESKDRQPPAFFSPSLGSARVEMEEGPIIARPDENRERDEEPAKPGQQGEFIFTAPAPLTDRPESANEPTAERPRENRERVEVPEGPGKHEARVMPSPFFLLAQPETAREESKFRNGTLHGAAQPSTSPGIELTFQPESQVFGQVEERANQTAAPTNAVPADIRENPEPVASEFFSSRARQVKISGDKIEYTNTETLPPADDETTPPPSRVASEVPDLASKSKAVGLESMADNNSGRERLGNDTEVEFSVENIESGENKKGEDSGDGGEQSSGAPSRPGKTAAMSLGPSARTFLSSMPEFVPAGPAAADASPLPESSARSVPSLATALAGAAPDLSSGVIGAIERAMSVMKGDGSSVARINVSPPELGDVKLMVEVSGEKVKARINAPDHASAAVIRANVHELEWRLDRGGLVLDSIEVEVGSDGKSGDGRSFYKDKPRAEQKRIVKPAATGVGRARRTGREGAIDVLA